MAEDKKAEKKKRSKVITKYRLEGYDKKTKEVVPIMVDGNMILMDSENDCSLVKFIIMTHAKSVYNLYDKFYACKVITRIEPGNEPDLRKEV